MLFYLYDYCFTEKIIDYVYVIGIMFGIATATTGFPFNMIESEQVSNEERSKYNI